jgi:RimJ/RimL family protein N-acetyltransferase
VIDPPLIETPRLVLRAPDASDAAAIQEAASRREIADTMISLPHPYTAGEAARYIARQQAQQSKGRGVTFIITDREGGRFCGLTELRDIDQEHSQAELSFWLAVEAWGRGYMYEAIPAVVRYGFATLGLNRIYAHHMLRNPASGRVLEKAGFRREGVLRQRVRKWGRYEDVALWAILRGDWRGSRTD